MIRKNIFEILEEKYDIKEEMIKFSALFNSIEIPHVNPLNLHQELYTIEQIADDIIACWKARGSCLNCAELKEKINLTQDFDDKENVLTTLEYYVNILFLIEQKVLPDHAFPLFGLPKYYMLSENIKLLLEHLNHQKIIIAEEEKVILVPKDPAAIAVAEISSDDVAFAIMKYHHASLKGNLNEKRRLLVSIANEYEPLLEKPIDGFYEYIKDAKNMLNNAHIRHNNKEGSDRKELIANMSDEELEHWYDELYQLLLFCVLAKDNKERKEKIHAFLAEINAKPDKK